jgi:hypothetical protein
MLELPDSDISQVTETKYHCGSYASVSFDFGVVNQLPSYHLLWGLKNINFTIL